MNETSESRSGLSLWRFSLSVYGAAGVQQECLDLQDRHAVNVNLLLFCAYVGAVHSAVLEPTDVQAARAATLEWNSGVVQKLREVRRAMKLFLAGASADAALVAALREEVKKTELEAERIEHAMLETWGQSHIERLRRANAAAAVAANIRTLFEVCSGATAQPQSPNHLIAAAIAATTVSS